MHPDQPFARFVGNIAGWRFLVERPISVFNRGHFRLLAAIHQVKIERHSEVAAPGPLIGGGQVELIQKAWFFSV